MGPRFGARAFRVYGRSETEPNALALATAMVVALRAAYGMSWGPLVLMLLCVPLIAIHEPPFGPIGLAMFILAIVLFVRQRASVSEQAVPPLERPAPVQPA